MKEGLPFVPEAPEYNDESTEVAYRVFESGFGKWEGICAEAAEFASSIAAQDLISISHSKSANRRTVIVWYRTSK